MKEIINFIQENTKSTLVRMSLATTILFALFFTWTKLADAFASKGFEAHGHCLLWNRGLVSLYVVSDFVIWLSYVFISAVLITLVAQVWRTHRILPFPLVFLAFGLFIISCGFTHFMDILTLWFPFYETAGMLKNFTAWNSIITAYSLPFCYPKIIQLIDSASRSEQRRKELEEAQGLLMQEAADRGKPLKMLINELTESAQLIRNFVSQLSHEVRNGLHGIRGYGKQLHDKEFPEERRKKCAGYILYYADRLENLINNLLDFEFLKSGEAQFIMKRVDLNALITKVYDQSRAAFKTHTFHLELDIALPECTGDSAKLEQVLTNLIQNAMKYSEESILIGSRFCMKQRMAHVWIQDHGIGIPREYLEKIFDPFVRLGVSHTIKGGSGLGLAISRQIIKMHGGQIWADSAGDGKGSIFCFALPLAADDVDDSVTERRAAIRQKAR